MVVPVLEVGEEQAAQAAEQDDTLQWHTKIHGRFFRFCSKDLLLFHIIVLFYYPQLSTASKWHGCTRDKREGAL